MSLDPHQWRVVVTREIPGEALTRLQRHVTVMSWPEYLPPSTDELHALVQDADGVLTMITDRVDAALLDAGPKIRVVSNMAVGVDNFDLVELTKRGIPAGHTPNVLTEATADLTFALLLAVARRVTEASNSLLAGEWKTWHPRAFLGLELAGSTLGIVGIGRIGEAVARRAEGFGMRVVAWSRSDRTVDGVETVALPELLQMSDVVSIHAALSPETRHLIGAAEFALMKPGAILVNTARGAIVDQAALYAALESGHLAGAGLDVFETEPVPLDEPLLKLSNCLAVPHIGSATRATRSAMAELAVDNILAGLLGHDLPHCANPEVYVSR